MLSLYRRQRQMSQLRTLLKYSKFHTRASLVQDTSKRRRACLYSSSQTTETCRQCRRSFLEQPWGHFRDTWMQDKARAPGPRQDRKTLGFRISIERAGFSTTFRIFLRSCVDLKSKRRACSTSPCVALARDHYCVLQEQNILRSHHPEVLWLFFKLLWRRLWHALDVRARGRVRRDVFVFSRML